MTQNYLPTLFQYYYTVQDNVMQIKGVILSVPESLREVASSLFPFFQLSIISGSEPDHSLTVGIGAIPIGNGNPCSPKNTVSGP